MLCFDKLTGKHNNIFNVYPNLLRRIQDPQQWVSVRIYIKVSYRTILSITCFAVTPGRKPQPPGLIMTSLL